jgi:hypothetical protein
MYFEDEHYNLISLDDYINIARMIGANTKRNTTSNTTKRGNITFAYNNSINMFSCDTINRSVIGVYCNSEDIKRYGSLVIFYKFSRF